MITDDNRWQHMTSYDLKWHQMTSDDIRWHRMTSDDIKWHQITSDENRWQQIASNKKVLLLKCLKIVIFIYQNVDILIYTGCPRNNYFIWFISTAKSVSPNKSKIILRIEPSLVTPCRYLSFESWTTKILRDYNIYISEYWAIGVFRLWNV